MDALPRQKLCEIIASYGRSLCDDPRRLEAILRDFCGAHQREINVLLNALKEQVVADLLTTSQSKVPRAMQLARLTKRLEDNLALSQDAARWAVDSWALALGVISIAECKTERAETPVSTGLKRRPKQRKRSANLKKQPIQLTQRQEEVLGLMAEGHGDHQIAQLLSINANTVNRHISNIQRKIGVITRSDLINWAIAQGIKPQLKQKRKPSASIRRSAHQVGELHRFEGHTGKVTSVAFSPDGQRVLSGSAEALVLWDITSGHSVWALEWILNKKSSKHKVPVLSVTFSPDGQQALIGLDDATVRLLSSTNGTNIIQFQGHSQAITSVAFSPDGQRVLSGSMDETMRLWDVATGRELQCFEGQKSRVSSVAFSPDGHRVLSGSHDSKMRLFDVATGQEQCYFKAKGLFRHVNSVAFSPDGSMALSGGYGKSVRLWDVVTGRELQRFEGHAGWLSEVTSVAFSPCGKRVLSGSSDTSVRLWDVATGRELQCFEGHTQGVNCVDYSPDGNLALSASNDENVCVWGLPI